MITDIFKLYQIGKDLGLSKKEINARLLFDKNFRFKFIFIITMIIIFVLWIVSLTMLNITIARNTYGRGTLYSTVSIHDFKKKRVRRFI
jgi:hypothetical protein